MRSMPTKYNLHFVEVRGECEGHRAYVISAAVKIISEMVSLCIRVPAPIAHLVECPLRGTGGHGFDPRPRHTKVVKNGTSCFSLGTQIYGVELGLVDPVSG